MNTKNPNHRELEVKIDAEKVDVESFKSYCFSLGATRYEHIISPDTYYTQGKNVVRHRHGGNTAGELTVKRRTSKSSTRDRVEIDLRFDTKTTEEDVRRFLEATGWVPSFTVIKDCHIFWINTKSPGIEIVLYDVRCVYPEGTEVDSKRFVEIEIHKAESNHPNALGVLLDVEQGMRKLHPLGDIQKLSLYEIYSGKRYGMAKP